MRWWYNPILNFYFNEVVTFCIDRKLPVWSLDTDGDEESSQERNSVQV